MARDRKEPGGEARRRPIARCIAGHGEPDILHQLLRRRAVADVTHEITPGAHFMPPIQLGERHAVAARVADDQRLVTLSRVLHSFHYGSYTAPHPGGSGTNARSGEAGKGLSTGSAGCGRLMTPSATRFSRL